MAQSSAEPLGGWGVGLVTDNKKRRCEMLRAALGFLILAVIAGVLGFGGIAALSVDIARILVIVFLLLFVVAMVMHALRGRAPPV